MPNLCLCLHLCAHSGKPSLYDSVKRTVSAKKKNKNLFEDGYRNISSNVEMWKMSFQQHSTPIQVCHNGEKGQEKSAHVKYHD